MIAFKAIRARAAKRKGGEAALASLLPKVPSPKGLARVTDDRVLAEMSKRIFSAGFVWSVIEKKWPRKIRPVQKRQISVSTNNRARENQGTRDYTCNTGF